MIHLAYGDSLADLKPDHKEGFDTLEPASAKEELHATFGNATDFNLLFFILP